jgi:hypothetical protein
LSYQFCDSFDHYNTALISTMYDFVNGSPLISSAYARYPAIGSYPNQGISVPTGSVIRKNLKSNQSTLIAFMSFGVAGLPAGTQIILPFWDAGILQCFLGLTSTGALQFCTQVPTFGTVAIGPSSALGLISPSTKPVYGIEVLVTFAGSGGGSVQCYLDGALVIALTAGLTTIKSANAYANQIGINAPGGAGYNNGLSIYSDYLRVWDTTGSYQNAILGKDVRKLTKLPQGVGDLTQWTPNGAASNWQCVNENPPDGDTSYVSSAGNLYDSYGMGSAGLVANPTMVVAKSYARKDDGATRDLELGVRSVGVNGLGSPAVMSSSYAFYDSCISTDPATGTPPLAAAADLFQHVKYESI